MLDIRFIRENAALVKKDLKKRKAEDKLKLVDDILQKDENYRKLLQEGQELRHKRNIATQEINELKKAGQDISKKIKEVKALPDQIKELDEKINTLKDEIKHALMRIPNILDESVPVGKDAEDNKVVRTWGVKPKFDFELINHGELAEKLKGANFDDASRVSGNGFYYLLGEIALLEQALIQFAIQFLSKKSYMLVTPPFMLHREPYEGVTDLADFETMMYKIDQEDLYLIATSEHAIGAMHMGKTFDENQLPLRYAGLSPCFRKEIGSHGIDTKGFFRVHQFNKVEQFIFCKPEDSKKLHEELLANAEALYQKLKLPYRVVNICTGDIGTVAAKKYDIEVWMPREKTYREVVSCSNCTAYQATRLNIKYRKGAEKEYVHTLNSTAIATGRTLRAILEHYQQKNGTVKVPAVLAPFMNGIKVIGAKK